MDATNTLASLGFTHPPRQVVSLVPSVTESLFELGVGDRLVGLTEYCVYPADKVRGVQRMGGTKNPNLEQIKAAAPDLVIVNQEENRPEDVAALRAAGLTVWVTFPRTVRAAIDLLWDFTRLFNVPRMGQALSVLETAYEWATLANANAAPVKVFCPIWRETEWWMTFNQDTYVHDLLRLCGAVNVFAERERRYPLTADLSGGALADHLPVERDTRYPRVTLAEVASHAPEVILLPSEPYAFTDTDRVAFDAFPAIPAVKNKRILLVDGSLLTWHGIRLAKALAEIPALVVGK